MTDFLASTLFLWASIGVSVAIVVFAALWNNLHWEARGITPTEDVERLRERMKKLFPRSFFAWVVVGAIVLAAVGMWSLYGAKEGAFSQALQSPSPTKTWEATKNYWFWIVLILLLSFGRLCFVEKPWANKLQWLVAAIATLLFVVIPIVDEFWGEKSAPQQSSRQACPSSSKTDVNRCLVTKAGVRVRTEPSINPEEFAFCWVRPEGSIIESKWLGPDLLQIKSGGEDFQIEYKWMRKSDLTGGTCPNKF